jgi:uncharacterized membrane protein
MGPLRRQYPIQSTFTGAAAALYFSSMSKSRIEAFSDGVLAIIITIMVLELRPPHEVSWEGLVPLVPVFLSYSLSFVFIGIYWNNHHYILHAAKKVDGRVLWPNMNLLFWLSLIPFATAWMGESFFAVWPVAFYGVVQFLAGLAYFVLERALIGVKGQDPALARAIGNEVRGWVSMVSYAVAVPAAFLNVWLALAVYVFVAALWVLPDRRIEKKVNPADL